ncbi:hypothetical protein ACTD5D_20485 [Nocardia takedensis]|uniref:hypothetical protein n=1 Tax=Nocardia takedensis TaxID=259390 RepID=UPI003F775A13
MLADADHELSYRIVGTAEMHADVAFDGFVEVQAHGRAVSVEVHRRGCRLVLERSSAGFFVRFDFCDRVEIFANAFQGCGQ